MPSQKNIKMSNLSKVFIFKIAATVIFWCAPLLLLPSGALEELGFPKQPSYMFVRLLGWAYLALCVSYYFGLHSSLSGKPPTGAIWVGIVSNGGAFLYLLYYGVSGTWVHWGGPVQLVTWSSTAATALITLSLYVFGVRGGKPTT